jgi:hypothetical protein
MEIFLYLILVLSIKDNLTLEANHIFFNINIALLHGALAKGQSPEYLAQTCTCFDAMNFPEFSHLHGSVIITLMGYLLV